MPRLKALRTFTDASTERLIMEGQEFDCADGAVGELVESGLAETLPRGKRPTKAELLEQAEAEMTNPELYKAVQAARKSPAKPKVRRKAK